ncbi:MAG: glucosyltransferase domain-containing protein [Clostridiales bacterium]|nr:glucosyltransferase domain-containing protein [Clostridiales bacterium]
MRIGIVEHRPAPRRRPLTAQDMCFAAACTVALTLLAHAYRFLNAGFGLDAMLIAEQVDIETQISLGRFMQPLYWLVRGYITAPPVVALFATAFLAGAVLIVLALTGIRSRLGIALTCGVLAVNETLCVSYASYLPWVDVYMLSLLLCVAAVFVQTRFRRGFLLSPLLYCMALGLYQSYLQAAATLVMLMLLARALDGERPGALLIEGLGHAGAMLAGLLLYALVYRLAIALYGTSVSTEYNTVAEVGHYTLSAIPDLLKKTCWEPIRYFFAPQDATFLPPAVNVLLAVLALGALIGLAHKLPLASRGLIVLILAMLPFGMNFVTFISKGIVHMLMNYAYFFFYVLCILLAERAGETIAIRPAVLRAATPMLLAGVMGVSILTAQTLYMKRDLELQSTLSVMTRVLNLLEREEGYEPGETPVVLLNYLTASKVAMIRPGFEDISEFQGMRSTYADAYDRSHAWYLQTLLGYRVNLIRWEVCMDYTKDPITQDIPAFPDPDCVQMIDGIAFVRLK